MYHFMYYLIIMMTLVYVARLLLPIIRCVICFSHDIILCQKLVITIILCVVCIVMCY
jgi:hypothetical protein